MVLSDLLFSSIGVLTQKLLHPTHAVPKQYMALVQGLVDETLLSETLARGVETAEGTHTAELVHVQHLTQEDSQRVWQRVRDTLPPEYNVEELEERRFLPDTTTTPFRIWLHNVDAVFVADSQQLHRIFREFILC